MSRIHPILFNTEMVQAILKGRKTQTRRIIKDNSVCRPFEPGDILWVRETWAPFCLRKDTANNAVWCHSDFCYKASLDCMDEAGLGCKWRPSIHMPKEAARIFLRVKDVRIEQIQCITDADAHLEGVPEIDDYPIKSVYCPRCKGEGLIGGHIGHGYVEVDCPDCRTNVQRFSHLWDSTIKRADFDKYGWAANPWVWVIEFERCEKPQGFMQQEV